MHLHPCMHALISTRSMAFRPLAPPETAAVQCCQKRRLLKCFNRRDIPPSFFALESRGNRSSNLFCPTLLLARRTPSPAPSRVPSPGAFSNIRGFKQPSRVITLKTSCTGPTNSIAHPISAASSSRRAPLRPRAPPCSEIDFTFLPFSRVFKDRERERERERARESER